MGLASPLPGGERDRVRGEASRKSIFLLSPSPGRFAADLSPTGRGRPFRPNAIALPCKVGGSRAAQVPPDSHTPDGHALIGCGAGSAMLSRTADNLYWLARYVERAEYLARILEATQRSTALPIAYGGASNEWESALMTAGCAHAFFDAYAEANEETVTDFLAFSHANPSSIRNCFEVARTNARAVRTALTMEMWDAINGTWLELKRYGNGLASREEFMRFLRWVQESSLRFDGSAYRTMLRNDAYWFSRDRKSTRLNSSHLGISYAVF